jgi:hypothetical protein
MNIPAEEQARIDFVKQEGTPETVYTYGGLFSNVLFGDSGNMDVSEMTMDDIPYHPPKPAPIPRRAANAGTPATMITDDDLAKAANADDFGKPVAGVTNIIFAGLALGAIFYFSKGYAK